MISLKLLDVRLSKAGSSLQGYTTFSAHCICTIPRFHRHNGSKIARARVTLPLTAWSHRSANQLLIVDRRDAGTPEPASQNSTTHSCEYFLHVLKLTCIFLLLASEVPSLFPDIWFSGPTGALVWLSPADLLKFVSRASS